MKTCMKKKIHKLNDPNVNDDVQQVVLIFLRFWEKPRRSQQTHKYVLFQRSHNVGYFMNINAFIYVILLIGQKSICSTILTVTYSNWYQSNIHYLQVYSMLKKSSQKKSLLLIYTCIFKGINFNHLFLDIAVKYVSNIHNNVE